MDPWTFSRDIWTFKCHKNQVKSRRTSGSIRTTIAIVEFGLWSNLWLCYNGGFTKISTKFIYGLKWRFKRHHWQFRCQAQWFRATDMDPGNQFVLRSADKTSPFVRDFKEVLMEFSDDYSQRYLSLKHMDRSSSPGVP